MSEGFVITASKQLGTGVQKVRELRELTRSELARHLDTTEGEIEALEEGVLFFNDGYPQKVATALDVPLEVLVMMGADKSSLSDIDKLIVEKLIGLAEKLIKPTVTA